MSQNLNDKITDFRKDVADYCLSIINISSQEPQPVTYDENGKPQLPPIVEQTPALDDAQISEIINFCNDASELSSILSTLVRNYKNYGNLDPVRMECLKSLRADGSYSNDYRTVFMTAPNK